MASMLLSPGDSSRINPHLTSPSRVPQDDEPRSYLDAFKGEDEKEWNLVAESELNSLEENKTWEPCVLPGGRNVIPVKWIFKRNLNAEGKVCRYKARLVRKEWTSLRHSHDLPYCSLQFEVDLDGCDYSIPES